MKNHVGVNELEVPMRSQKFWKGSKKLCWKGRRRWETSRWVGSVELWSGGLCNGPCGLYRMGGGDLGRRKSDRTRSQRIKEEE